VAKGGHHVTPCPPIDRQNERARWAELGRGGKPPKDRGGKPPLRVRVPVGKVVFWNVDINGVWFGDEL